MSGVFYESLMYARVSDLTSYLYCPRLCYYRNRFEENSVSEMHAARDLYVSNRMNLDVDWARKKFTAYFGQEYEKVFNEAAQKFTLSSRVKDLKSVDWEVHLKSDKYHLKGVLDEMVKLGNTDVNADVNAPLVLSLHCPQKNVWFRDRIRLTAFSMILGSSKGYVYYCYDGDLKELEIERKDKRNVLKLVERSLNIKNGFIPQKKDDKKCQKCLYKERCTEKHSTFAQRFFK